MTETLAPIIGLLMIAFVTPGPNNFIVMVAAVRGGIRHAVPAIIGIIAGTVALYLLASVGLAHVLEYHHALERLLLVAGVGYLVILGLRMIVEETMTGQAPEDTTDLSMLAITLFQCVNPKSIALITTVAATTPDSVGMRSRNAIVIAMVAAACLALWAVAGASLSNWLRLPGRRRAFDAGMGLLMIGSAIVLLLYGWTGT